MTSVAHPALLSNPGGAPRTVAVLLPRPLSGPLFYAVPEGLNLAPGDIVEVTLNRRPQFGVVWDEGGAGLAPARLKPVERVVAPFRLERSLRQFIDWVASYTLAAPGEVLAMALRPALLTPDPPASWLRRGALVADGRAGTAPRARVLATLGDRVLPGAVLAAEAGVSRQVLRAMVQAGLLEPAPAVRAPAEAAPGSRAVLSAAQAAAAAALAEAVKAARFSVTLLQGATGSGKTEVYFEAIAACCASGRQALVLLPEIALSAQWLRRFEQVFGTAAAVWHSDLSPRTRRAAWQGTADGRVRVLVGARSALFLPFTELGLIVIDEEHDGAFKQEDGVIYHARDMAVVRGRLAQAAVVLVSATPSLESVANVASGRYRRLDLPQRHGGASLPLIAAVDLRKHPPPRGQFLSPALVAAMEQTLARGEQAMLFLNRRGYAPLTLCRACGHRLQCPHCTAWLVEHRSRPILACHHCGHTIAIPPCCPDCGAEGCLTAVGPGVERIEQEVAARFPVARRLVMASDLLVGPLAASRAARAVEDREVDIIIGTQIVAKGWHFPHLTLVGAVDADLGLFGGDLRAGERTMQLLHQVAGRAGRATAAGQVLLQTHQPDHPVMRALVAADLDGFMAAEAALRRPGHWPPYGRMAALIVSAGVASAAEAVARALGRAAPAGPGIVVLGPAPAPLAKLRGQHRQRLLLRTTRDIAVQGLLRQWLDGVKVPRSVRVRVDVDPISFL